MLAVAMPWLAKGSAEDLEVAGLVQLAAVFLFPPASSPCVVLQLVFQRQAISLANHF